MAKYRVQVKEIILTWYEVEAETPEAAKENYAEGEHLWSDDNSLETEAVSARLTSEC